MDLLQPISNPTDEPIVHLFRRPVRPLAQGQLPAGLWSSLHSETRGGDSHTCQLREFPLPSHKKKKKKNSGRNSTPLPLSQCLWISGLELCTKKVVLFLEAHLARETFGSTLALSKPLEHSFDPAALRYFPFLLCTFKILIYLSVHQ